MTSAAIFPMSLPRELKPKNWRERAGIVYIDVWDGFVDENGKYSNYGPDYEGQTRRLRSSDGVFFTKYGALKLAHYVERDLRRYMSNRVVTAPAAGSVEPSPSEKSPAKGPVDWNIGKIRRPAWGAWQQFSPWRCHRYEGLG